jgi:hypothetical protein
MDKEIKHPIMIEQGILEGSVLSGYDMVLNIVM